MNSSNKQKTVTSNQVKNPLETLREMSGETVKSAASGFTDMSSGFFDQFLGSGYNETTPQKETPQANKERAPFFAPRREFKTIWSMQQEKETRTIKELLVEVKREVKMIQKADSSLMTEVKDIDKLTIEMTQTRTGIYDIRFLEVVISILKTVRAKIAESQTWLSTFRGKESKKGFRSLSKKKGTKFSMSQELNAARSIQ